MLACLAFIKVCLFNAILDVKEGNWYLGFKTLGPEGDGFINIQGYLMNQTLFLERVSLCIPACPGTT